MKFEAGDRIKKTKMGAGSIVPVGEIGTVIKIREEEFAVEWDRGGEIYKAGNSPAVYYLEKDEALFEIIQEPFTDEWADEFEIDQ